MDRPNILLLFPDQHRGDWLPYPNEVLRKLDMEGLPINMPNLQNLMQEGVTFIHCITPSPLCAPARACLASGLRYERCGVVNNNQDYPVSQKTFYSVLKETGYNVGGVGKFDLHKPTHWWGLDGWVDELGKIGFTHAIDNEGKWDGYNSGKDEPKGPYFKFLHDNGFIKTHVEDFKRRRKDKHDTEPTALPEEAYCDNWLSQNAIEMISNFPKEIPWFLQVNFTGPHDPWDVTVGMKERWKDVEFPQPKGNDKVHPEKICEIRQNYAAMLENIDRNIGLILEAIEKRDELENTIIIYSADHGEMLGDLNIFGKSVPYRGSITIPLVVWGKGIKKGVTSKLPVELQDLAATIVDFCGTTMPEAKDSISIKPFLTGNGKQQQRKYQVSGLNHWMAVLNSKYKAVFRDGKLEEVYDIELDKWEMNNIKGMLPAVERELTEALAKS